MKVIDPDFFQSVVDRYYRDLYRFGLGLTRNTEEACDLVQQTYAVFAEKGTQIRDVTKAKQWLFTTLYRTFAATWNRKKHELPLDSVEMEMAGEPGAPAGLRHIEHQEALDALMALEENHRKILTLFYLNQLSYKEIADVLDIPLGTVMSRLSRAREHLRSQIGRKPNVQVIAFDSVERKTQHG